jgi:hypothetical protein
MMNMILEANDTDPNAATMDKIADAKKAAQEQYFALKFVLRSNCNQYGKLIENLENNYTLGQGDSWICADVTGLN